MTTVPLYVTSTTDNCRYCLMCRHVCPVGHVTHLETLTPHGWGLTIASVKRGLLDWNESTVAALYSCADCGCCRSHCINDQPLPDAIARARAEVAEAGGAPAEVYDTRDMLQQWGNPYREQIPQEPVGTGEDALFVGDEALYLWPEALAAARRLLEATGVSPVEIGAGRSSGYLASSLGFVDLARFSAQRTLDEVGAVGARRLFVLSAGDYFTFNQLFPERLGASWPEEVELTEITAYLDGQLLEEGIRFDPSEDETPYAYVDPTHAVRAPERLSPRTLLEAVFPGRRAELFWRRERAHPVGSTALRFAQPHLAQMLTRARLEDASRSGAGRIFCEDPATLAELSRYAAEFDLQVRGLYEALAEHVAV